MYSVSTDAAYAVLYSVLGLFTILAILSAGYGASLLPSSVRDVVVAHRAGGDGAEGNGKNDQSVTINAVDSSSGGLLATDFFLSARNSTGAFGIAMSFFASGMGAWVVYGTTEMGGTPQLSWLGVLGYSMASAIPGLFVMWLGPLIKEATQGEEAFSTTDFCRVRYGRIMQLACAAISVFYMWIYLVAEFTSISNVYALLVGKETFDWANMVNLNVRYTTGIAVSIGVITVFYTGVAGLPSSIVTDKFQGIMMASLVLLLTIVVTSVPENRVTREQFDLASNWTADGFYAMVTLILAIISAELFNQATWQRVWAAKDTPSLRKGFAVGSFLVFLLMMFFGIMGMIGYAKESQAYDNFEKFAYLAFFNILEPMEQGWHILVLIFVTSLAASSVDSLQNGITSLLSSDLLKISSNPELIKWMNRAILVGVNIAAVVKSAERYDVLGLFLVADLVCATSVFPVFLGLLNPDKWGYLAPTEWGAFMGCIGGIAAVLVIGVIVDSETYAKNPFEYFWLRDASALCSLCGTNRMWTFIVTPIISLVTTVVFTFIDIQVRTIKGVNPRAPIVEFSFDKKKDEAKGDEEKESKFNEDGIEEVEA